MSISRAQRIKLGEAFEIANAETFKKYRRGLCDGIVYGIMIATKHCTREMAQESFNKYLNDRERKVCIAHYLVQKDALMRSVSEQNDLTIDDTRDES